MLNAKGAPVRDCRLTLRRSAPFVPEVPAASRGAFVSPPPDIDAERRRLQAERTKAERQRATATSKKSAIERHDAAPRNAVDDRQSAEEPPPCLQQSGTRR